MSETKMTIRVKSFLTLKKVMDNQAMVDVQCGPITLFELLKLLAHRFGLDFKSMVFENGSWTVGVHVRILVNGRHYGTLPEKLDTRVTKEDDICKGVKSALDSCSLRC